MKTSVHGGSQLADAVGFVGAWVGMMTAMMLPSAAPLLLLYRLAGPGGRAVNTIPLVAGYLVMWAAFGALVDNTVGAGPSTVWVPLRRVL